MTQDEIIRMALEAGLFNQHNEDLLQDKEVMAQFERFAALVVAARDKQYLQLKYDFAGKFDATKENVFVAIEAIANGSYEE